MIAVVVVALAGWQVKLLLAALGGARNAPNVDTALVQKGPFVVGVTREGTLESANVAQVRAPQSGSTLTWLIDDGADVKEGDLVAKVDVSEYKFEVDRQRLEYQNRSAQVDQERRNRTRDFESAQMNVEKTLRGLDVLTRSQLVETEQGEAQVGYDSWNLTFARTDYDKQDRLWQAGIVPETKVEQSERKVRSREYKLTSSEKEVHHLDAEHSSKRTQMGADIDTAEFEAGLAEREIEEAVRSAEERAKMTKKRLAEMEKELAGGELPAPQAGVVVLGATWDQATQMMRSLQEGDRVWPRMNVADITDLSELQVKLRVDEASASRLSVGQEAVVTVVGIPDQEFTGELTNIGAVARRIPPWEDPNAPVDQRVFDVKVKLLDPDPEVVRPGMKAKVQFVFEKLPDAVYVPVEAVFDKPEGKVVYVTARESFQARRVETGERNDEAVVITKGLKAKERVALSDPTRPETE